MYWIARWTSEKHEIDLVIDEPDLQAAQLHIVLAIRATGLIPINHVALAMLAPYVINPEHYNTTAARN